jgi:16S rRNA C967 or C1407 C5-methylase (RsmB/RsmF family)
MSSRNFCLPRFLRVVGEDTPGSDRISIENEDKQLKTVKWLPSFRSLPGCLALSVIQESYGKDHMGLGLYPMDISSALPVIALDLNLDQPLKVLDLCCCPGGKLQFISECINPSQSLVVGVDIAVNRLHVCKSLLDKWRCVVGGGTRARQLLFHADGQSFGIDQLGALLYDSNLAKAEDAYRKGRKNSNKSSRNRELQQLREVQSYLTAILPSQGYDRVLVDAECTHDASYRHMQFFDSSESGQRRKWQKRSHEDLEDEESAPTTAADSSSMLLSHNITATDPAIDHEQRQSLQSLQRGLLENGFKSLRSGGLLIYSTCSADTAQNEDIVSWLLTEHANTELLPALPQFLRSSREEAQAMMDSLLAMPLEQQATKICDFYASRTTPTLLDGELPGTIRVDATCGMSGHFIAKIRKKES